MRKLEILTGTLLLLCAVSMFSSCFKDDVDIVIVGDGERLQFNVARSKDFTTRSNEASEATSIVDMSISELSGCKNLGTQLYLLETIEQRDMYPAEEAGEQNAEESDDEMITRGAPTTTDNFVSVHGSRGFGLFTYAYPPGSWDSEATTSEYIHNLPVRYWSSGDSGAWSVHDPSKFTYYHWPGANYNVRFYAYAPYSPSASNYYSEVISIPATAYSGVPKLSIGVSNTNQSSSAGLPSHPDIIIAKSDEVKGDYNNTQHLLFRHAMTGVRFVIGQDMIPGTIKKIQFQNVNRTGTLNLETQNWEEVGTKVAGIALTKDIAIEGDVDEEVLAADDYFMMVPQTLPSDAKIVITFVTTNDTEYTLVGNIGGKEWPMGTLITYKITPKAVAETYTFTVTTPTVLKDDYLGGATSEYKITSYKVSTSSVGVVTTEPIKWEAYFSTDNGSTWTTTQPDFFDTMTLSDTPSTSAPTAAKTYSAIIAPITPSDPKNPFGATVSARPENTTTTNLYSSNGNSTANCYVINKAGTYTFPLIYGNAVKSGSVNTKAFNPGGTSSTDYYAYFKDHANADIKSPYIYPDSINSVKLLWTDAPSLIKNVKLSGASQTMTVAGKAVRYISFTVPKEHLTPGNAVIAVRSKAGNIMWSWHIWVTPWAGTSIAVTSNSKSFNFSNTILGYCPARDATWSARSVKVRFKQSGSNKYSSTYSFSQTGNTIQYSEGNMPYYQWGRKDPMLMYNYVTNSSGIATNNGAEKTCYGQSIRTVAMTVWDSSLGAYKDYTYKGYFKISYATGSARSGGVYMSTSIKNPYTFYARHTTSGSPKGDGAEYDWCEHIGFNRWDATNTKNITSANAPSELATVKTIYDPCPPGWRVPPVGAFYGLTEAGGATAYGTPKTTMSTTDITPAFRVKANGGKGIKLPITGDRSRYNGAPWWNVSDARNVQLWTATPCTYDGYETCGYFASSGSKFFNGLSDGKLAKSSGFAVLPIKE